MNADTTGKEQTAIMELLFWIAGEQKHRQPTVAEIKFKACDLLAKEKRHIEQAFDTGWMSGRNEPNVCYGEDYYKNNFKNQLTKK